MARSDGAGKKAKTVLKTHRRKPAGKYDFKT
jgi:hypothetical protein